MRQLPDAGIPHDAEQAPGASDSMGGGRRAQVLPWLLSANWRSSLCGLRRSGCWSGVDGIDPVDVGWSLATVPSPVRRIGRWCVAGDREEFVAGLAALAAGEPAAGVVSGVAAGAGVGVVFVFPGQGSQWVGMAAELLESSPVFRAIGWRSAAGAGRVSWTGRWLEVLRGEPGAPSLERVDVVQPVLFAVMVSLARLWRVGGVAPAAVVGHSQGEIAAACVAGALSLPDAARVVALRARRCAALAGRGGMVSVALPVEQVRGAGGAVGGADRRWRR